MVDQEDIYNQLIDKDKLKDGGLAIFCGAGISKNSGIPLARETNRHILEVLKIDDKDINELNNNIPFEAFMEIISDYGNLPTDFSRSILDMYNHSKPNINHLVIAKLAKEGFIKTIITTNFDTLIEDAFKLEGWIEKENYNVYCREDELIWENFYNDKVNIFKIHGSSSDKESIRITLTSIANKSFSQKRKDLIDFLFSSGPHNTVLVLGYSCSDIDLVPCISSISSSNKNIIFIHHKTGLPINSIDMHDVEQMGDMYKKNPFTNYNKCTWLAADTDIFFKEIIVYFEIKDISYINNNDINFNDWKVFISLWYRSIQENSSPEFIKGNLYSYVDNLIVALRFYIEAGLYASDNEKWVFTSKCYIKASNTSMKIDDGKEENEIEEAILYYKKAESILLSLLKQNMVIINQNYDDNLISKLISIIRNYFYKIKIKDNSFDARRFHYQALHMQKYASSINIIEIKMILAECYAGLGIAYRSKNKEKAYPLQI